MSTTTRRRGRAVSGSLVAALALGATLIGLPGTGSPPVAEAVGLEVIALEAVNDNLIILGGLASRSQQKPVTIAGIGPYTITGTDSNTSQPYSFVTAFNYSASNPAWANESDERADSGMSFSSNAAASFDGRAPVLSLTSSGGCTGGDTGSGGNRPNGIDSYCSVFGPEVYSEPFDATVGQSVSFDWAAQGGGDDYEAYAYLVEVTETSPGVYDYGDPASHVVLDYGRGTLQGWLTASGPVPSNGSYRFRFVNGTYDKTGGLAIGANMYIDSVVRLGTSNPITFAPLGDRVIGSGDVTLSATSASPGDPVSFSTTSSSSVCTLSGDTVTIVGVGVCAISADHPGDGVTYVPASTVTRSFTILAAATAPTNSGVPLIQGQSVPPADGDVVTATEGTWGDGGSTITGTTAGFESNGAPIAGVSGSSCVLVADAGSTLTYTVTKTNAVGSTEATSASIVGFTCSALPVAPSWTDKVLGSLRVGTPFNDGVTATGTPAPTYSVSAGTLPAGLALNPTTGAITGTPTTAGAYSFTIRADNGVGSGITQAFSGNVIPAADPTVEVVPPAAPDAPLVVVGGGFVPGTEVDVVIDGVVVATVTADSSGNIRAEVDAPDGEYSIEVRPSGGDESTSLESRRIILGFDGIAKLVPENSGYVPLVPSRVLDTRESGERLDADSTYRLAVTPDWNVPDSATSVALNVTATIGAGEGFLTVFPCGTDRPLASAVNYVSGTDTPNLTVVEPGENDEICIYSQLAVDLVVDLSGYFGDGVDTRLESQTPTRLLDTRGVGPIVGGAQAREVQVTGEAGAPEAATAAVLNVAAVNAAGVGFITLFPCDEDMPIASNVNYEPGKTNAGQAFVKLSSTGSVCVFSHADVDIVMDLNASFVPAGSSQFISNIPTRVLDTRDGEMLEAGDIVELGLAGADGVEGATALALNVTATMSQGEGFLTTFPCADGLPLASSVNLTPGRSIANHSTATPDADGNVCIYTSTATHLVVDVEGVYI